MRHWKNMIHFFLRNRITIFAVLVVLVLISSFSNDYIINKSYEDDDLLRAEAYYHDQNSETQATEKYEDSLLADPGLKFTTIELIAPGFLPVGEPLHISAALSGYDEGLVCLLVWYINDEPVEEYRMLTGTEIPGFIHKIKYSRIMEESIDIKVSLQYTTILNELQIIETEKTIIIENYSIDHWKEVETPRVLGMVNSRYNGDFTLEWALEHDYDDFDKELYINANGYTSTTEYLIWVNRCYQRANVFIGTGEANEWKLHKVFIIATGEWLNSTPRGVTSIPSRTTVGWAFPEEGYRVEPVGIEQELGIEWESGDEDVFVFTNVVGGVELTGIAVGTANLILRVGDTETSVIVRITG